MVVIAMSRKNGSLSDNEPDRWTIAARKAREEIAKTRARICMLEKSIKIFEKKSMAREPWPGESAKN